MKTYISPKETSRHEHPHHYVETADPPTKPGACRNWLRQALMSGQVDTRFQFQRVSKEPGTKCADKNSHVVFNNTTSPHVRIDRHDVLVLFASEELGTSVWAKICMFYLRTQQVVGKVPAPATPTKA